MCKRGFFKRIGLLLSTGFLMCSFKPVLALTREVELSLHLMLENVPVGTDVNEDGFRQINYEFEGEKISVTEENYTHADPETDGEYITWMAQVGAFWQVFLYHIPSGETIQLTTIGNNVNPVISKDRVAWEGQVKGVWQIFVFDGIRVTQITEGEGPCQDVGIEDEYVVYSQKVGEGWKVYLYNIDTKETINLTPNSFGKAPTISNGMVSWKSNEGGGLVVYFYSTLTGVTLSMDEYTASKAFDKVAFDEFVSTQESTEAPPSEIPDTEELLLVDEKDIMEELGPIEEVPESTESEVVESAESTKSMN